MARAHSVEVCTVRQQETAREHESPDPGGDILGLVAAPLGPLNSRSGQDCRPGASRKQNAVATLPRAGVVHGKQASDRRGYRAFGGCKSGIAQSHIGIRQDALFQALSPNRYNIVFRFDADPSQLPPAQQDLFA